MNPNIKSKSDIDAMRESGQILGKILALLSGQVQPGITTLDLDRIAAEETRRLGGEPAFLGHEGYAFSLCTSINEAVVHGVPSGRELKAGDIIGLDYGVRFKGLITDAAVTIPVGEASPEATRLLSTTEAALYAGIDQARAGNRVGDVSSAIENVLKSAGLCIVEELTGHGVGHSLWEPPSVPNYGTPGNGSLLKPGMTLAIEPMAALGDPAIKVLGDQWTLVTQDGSLAAQFEHTILITDSSAEILTRISGS